MQIKLCMMTLGMIAEHCYLLQNSDTGEMLIIDPGDHASAIEEKITQMQGRPVLILLTHGHFDHIGAADELRRVYGIDVACMAEEAEVLADTEANLTDGTARPVTLKPDRTFRDGEEFVSAGIRVQVIFTPGHTKGGCSYYLPDQKLLFCGDTLFHGSAGRTDFPTGSSRQLMDSINEKLMLLPDETKIYPGHEDISTIGWERKYNPFVRCAGGGNGKEN